MDTSETVRLINNLKQLLKDDDEINQFLIDVMKASTTYKASEQIKVLYDAWEVVNKETRKNTDNGAEITNIIWGKF